MANLLQSNGAQPHKQTRFAPIWTNRFFQGLWTQRSPLRDAGSTRIEEKFYGTRGDALIDGSNIELTNRLTLARRPGLSFHNSNDFGPVQSFYSFRYFDGTQEQIKVIVDTASTIYHTAFGGKTAVYTKPTSKPSMFKSVGSTLFWGDGATPKKLMTSTPWKALTAYAVAQSYVDPRGNLQKVTTAGTSAAVQPLFWATTLNGTTNDGSVVWTCVGSAVQNWGTVAPTVAPANQPMAYVGSACRYWSPNTSVAAGYTIADSNGNIQLMTTTTPTGGQTLKPTVISNGSGALAYQNTDAAIDGDPNSFSYVVIQHHAANANCTWGFSWSGAAPPVSRLNILSEVPYNGERFPGQDYTYGDDGNYWDTNRSLIVTNTSATIEYSTNGGSTWTNVYSSGPRSKQWDAIDLPGGTDPSQVRVRASAIANSDMCHFVHEVNLVCEEAVVVSNTALTTGQGFPKWNATLYGATLDGSAVWINCGSIMQWQAATAYTLTGPSAAIVDSNGNLQVIQSTGTTGATAPTWKLTPGDTTTDGTVTWLNCGTGNAVAFQGWQHVYSYHCLDGHVSTSSPVSFQTGPVLGGTNIPLSGAGSADPQVDTIWIFRTLDGGSTFLYEGEVLNPGANATWQYMDTLADAELNEFMAAPVDNANDPPPSTTMAPEYHLGRMFIAAGNTVYYSQSYTTVGVAVQSFPPLNYFIFPSTVTRTVSTAVGLLVFTISDVYVILGTTSLYASQFIRNVGLLNYFALDINGSTILLLTSDNQFISLDPSAGVSELGFPIGDRLTLFNPAQAYVTWHVDGSQDKAIYISDGATGWYRCNPTSAPESGLTWSPFATVTGGCTCVQSIEVSPGVHKLLVGGVVANVPGVGTATVICKRDPSVSTDAGTAYDAYGVIGSIVLAQPGQMAEIAFLSMDARLIAGAQPPVLGVILDEALPYYTGSFAMLNAVVNDPPKLPASTSLYSKRAYMQQSQEPSWCRHMQVKVDFGTDTYQQELLSLTMFGTVYQEA